MSDSGGDRKCAGYLHRFGSQSSRVEHQQGLLFVAQGFSFDIVSSFQFPEGETVFNWLLVTSLLNKMPQIVAFNHIFVLYGHVPICFKPIADL